METVKYFQFDSDGNMYVFPPRVVLVEYLNW